MPTTPDIRGHPIYWQIIKTGMALTFSREDKLAIGSAQAFLFAFLLSSGVSALPRASPMDKRIELGEEQTPNPQPDPPGVTPIPHGSPKPHHHHGTPEAGGDLERRQPQKTPAPHHTPVQRDLVQSQAQSPQP
ncbi:hypothetical protein A1F94_001968 [Pyrenophora tritici-repentis]|uniref:Uncharacterized protein n=1 Tax=Pyrenophora tritici-repentis TaxID=45151 RepID=A0A2W1EP67_9PLEO|nr:hypothetical protein PtrV1_02571 [Pyrenophora tritici-repentis]KAF7455326.1 hypothetical protein A1F99_025840 [Pyrenophora tritici-repentis]KAF7578511.1 hypothetical protein PtrM4_027510 [Pyrenophora tritici-repentis]KAG9389075.1 hypothetical protein A1F94_001968 [Pyrenophora tritici-repentis]KAI0570178.1 hypothetical protein Alg130_11329 [Pyrenophora tritici-repentis]